MPIIIPDDYFEKEPLGDWKSDPANAGSFFNSLALMEQVPSRSPVTCLQTGSRPCPKNDGLYMYNPASGKSMTLPCKSRLCPVCGQGWARKWQNRLGWNEFFNRDDKALTLTSAYDPGYKMFWLALKLFWRHIRNYAQVRPLIMDNDTGEIKRDKLYHKISPTGVKRWLKLKQKKLESGGETFRIIRPFRKLEYFGVVEYNQNHTQPHFHFVLRSGYIPQVVLQKCWKKAQFEAGFRIVAFDVRIEKIRDSVKQYFFKYITKLIEGKDELPKPGQWNGRGVRYSKEFFAAKAPLMNAAIGFEQATKRGDYSKFYAIYSRNASLAEQKFDIDYIHQTELEYVVTGWNPAKDSEKAGIPLIFEKWITFEPFDPDKHKEHVPAGPLEFSFEPRAVALIT